MWKNAFQALWQSALAKLRGETDLQRMQRKLKAFNEKVQHNLRSAMKRADKATQQMKEQSASLPKNTSGTP